MKPHCVISFWKPSSFSAALCTCYFNLLVSFQSSWNFPRFQGYVRCICGMNLSCILLWDLNIHWVFLAFTSRTAPLLATKESFCFALWYTECPRRNVPDFGRVFFMLKYTNITQNTYIQSWTVTEIMAREVWNFNSCYTLIDYQIHIKTGRNMLFL